MTKYITKQIDELTPDPRNARVHPPEQITRIAGSIKEFGFLVPVLISKDNQIIAGHGRVEAARKAGLSDVPCVQVEHLSKTQQMAYVLADNRLAMMATWDQATLATEMEDLQELDIDVESLGFTTHEIDEALQGFAFEPGEVDGQGQLDELSPKICKCPKCGYQFDLRQYEKSNFP